MSLTDPSKRLEAIPPYMFAELERKVAEKKKAGIDVISLGIGDPDMPTFPHVVEAMQAAVAENDNQKYPPTAAARSSATRSPASTGAASGSRSTPSPR